MIGIAGNSGYPDGGAGASAAEMSGGTQRGIPMGQGGPYLAVGMRQ